jgi:hypothetical protein
VLLACGVADGAEQNCGLPPHANVCIGTVQVPAQFNSKFERGVQDSIEAVFSDGFERALADFIRLHAGVPSIADSWRGQAAAVSASERTHYTNSINIVTKGGVSGWMSRTFAHNVAYEGVTKANGTHDIPVNRYGMRLATPGAIANTIAHEVAHVIGLRHPDSDTNLPRAFCEPPYVIGTIVRQIAEGPEWRWNSSFDCGCFAPGANQNACVP